MLLIETDQYHRADAVVVTQSVAEGLDDRHIEFCTSWKLVLAGCSPRCRPKMEFLARSSCSSGLVAVCGASVGQRIRVLRPTTGCRMAVPASFGHVVGREAAGESALSARFVRSGFITIDSYFSRSQMILLLEVLAFQELSDHFVFVDAVELLHHPFLGVLRFVSAPGCRHTLHQIPCSSPVMAYRRAAAEASGQNRLRRNALNMFPRKTVFAICNV